MTWHRESVFLSYLGMRRIRSRWLAISCLYSYPNFFVFVRTIRIRWLCFHVLFVSTTHAQHVSFVRMNKPCPTHSHHVLFVCYLTHSHLTHSHDEYQMRKRAKTRSRWPSSQTRSSSDTANIRHHKHDTRPPPHLPPYPHPHLPPTPHMPHSSTRRWSVSACVSLSLSLCQEMNLSLYVDAKWISLCLYVYGKCTSICLGQ